MSNMLSANGRMIQLFASRKKCWACKHKFDKPVLLPVEKIRPGVFNPNINPEVLVHHYDTHGVPPDIIRAWIISAIYGLERTEFGAKGKRLDFVYE